MGRLVLKLLLIAIFTGILVCPGVRSEDLNPNDWKMIDAEGRFSFSLPSDMEQHHVLGVDSYVGEYQNNNLRLSFDFGWYSDPLNYSYEREYEEINTKIDGKHAKIVTFQRTEPQQGFLYVAAVHFPIYDLGKDGTVTKLTVWVNCKGRFEQEIAKKIFQSIKFPISQKQ